MKALVVYESMYGNTRRVADAVARGLAQVAEVDVVPVARARPDLVDTADLLVVGGPTHAHSMSRASTRQAAVDQAKELPVEPGASGAGLREWFAALGPLEARSAAFDTRVELPATLTGRASKGIAKELRHHRSQPVGEPESFFVDKANRLKEGEERRAEEWGRELAQAAIAPDAPRAARR